jgi:hypothetical protein
MNLRPILLISLCLITSATVQAATDSDQSGGSAYQGDLIDQTLQASHFKIDPKPEGKKIERIVIVPYDVFLHQDFWPNFLNIFHSTTKSDVIERELLFKEGDRWNTDQVLESGRNIRNYLLVTIGQIIPVQGRTRGSVIALVVTKDLWSLRTNFNFSYVGSTLQQFGVQLTEENLAGRNKQVSGLYSFDLDTNQFGEQAADPRVLGSRVAVNEQAGVITNRMSGNTEGGYGLLSIGQPLYSLSTEWSWNLSSSVRKDIFRQYFADGVEEIASPVATGDGIPYEYNERLIDLSATVTRSFGEMNKTDFTFGWQGAIHEYELPNYGTLGVSPQPQSATQNYFLTNVVPYSERASMLIFGIHEYTGYFSEKMDVNTFALTELFREGPNVNFQLSYANRAFGLDSNYWGASLNAGENWISGDNIFSVAAIGGVRYETGLQSGQTTVATDGTPWVNRIGSINVKEITPKIGHGHFPVRVVADVQYVRRSEDLNHSTSNIGGDTNLRGYPSQYLVGPQLVSGNLEVRTDPVAFKSLHFGEAAFIDCGDAFQSPQSVQIFTSVGFGERILFPEFDKTVLRLDLAFPLNAVVGANPAYFSAQFGQAF